MYTFSGLPVLNSEVISYLACIGPSYSKTCSAILLIFKLKKYVIYLDIMK